MNLKDPFTFFALLTILNVLAYVLNISISVFWDKSLNIKSIATKKEVVASLVTLFLNILISVPGFVLWSKEVIVFSDVNPWLTFLLVFLIMDFLMYLLHWLSHNWLFLRRIHLKHHEHSEKFNFTSLYYLSEWETILFGLLLTVLALVVPLNLYGFIAFLVFNWLYGVITHLNTKSNHPYFIIFTNNIFHKIHHQLSNKNYGFYTFFWDKIFGTEEKKYSD